VGSHLQYRIRRIDWHLTQIILERNQSLYSRSASCRPANKGGERGTRRGFMVLSSWRRGSRGSSGDSCMIGLSVFIIDLSDAVVSIEVNDRELRLAVRCQG
jgi:hypothetical protein